MRTGPARRVVISVALSLAATFAAVGWTRHNRERLAAARASMRTSSAPGARLYEAVFDRLLGGFYDKVADDIAAVLRRVGPEIPRVLEIGPGPGGLALRLASRMPTLVFTGIDIDPAMVERATERAAAGGFGDRLAFRVGDVADLPFDDASFDLVTSTFSVHHWADAPAGFAEIARVLRPGGQAVVYDLPDGWGRVETRAAPLAAAARAAFPDALVTTAHWPGRVPLGRRLHATHKA
jgi:ubiquinone/menaquinone biosynthesis C-methylase UbiE